APARSDRASRTTARATSARAPLSFAASSLDALGLGVEGLEGAARADLSRLARLPARDRHHGRPYVLAEPLVRRSNQPAAGDKNDLPRSRSIRMPALHSTTFLIRFVNLRDLSVYDIID